VADISNQELEVSDVLSFLQVWLSLEGRWGK